MTITAQTSKTGPYSGNGTTTVFSYTFEVQDEAHLVVTLADATGVETVQALNTDYTVSGVGNANGGQITMATAPGVSFTLTISRSVPLTQEVDLENRRSVAPEVLEDAYDKLTQIAQDLSEQLGRAIKVGVSTASPADLPPSDRAGKFLAFDAAGNPTYASGSGGDAALRADLAAAGAGTGADLIGYTAGTGATARTVQERLRDAVSVKDFGAVGDGVADDTVAVQNAVNSGLPLNWGNLIYRITSPLVETVAKIDWIGSGAVILYDGAYVQEAVKITCGIAVDHRILGLTFDANQKANVAGKFVAATVSETIDQWPNFYASQIIARNAYRANTTFPDGDGFRVDGGFNHAEIDNIRVHDCYMAAGAEIFGFEGIFGITFASNGARRCRNIRLSDYHIENVWSEDGSYFNDQDGVRIFQETAERTSSCFVLNGTIKNVSNRAIKLHSGVNAVVDGLYRELDANVIPQSGAFGNPDIDSQQCPSTITNCRFHYDGAWHNEFVRNYTERTGGFRYGGASVSDITARVVNAAGNDISAVILSADSGVLETKHVGTVSNIAVDGQIARFLSIVIRGSSGSNSASLVNAIGEITSEAVRATNDTARLRVTAANIHNTNSASPVPLGGSFSTGDRQLFVSGYYGFTNVGAAFAIGGEANSSSVGPYFISTSVPTDATVSDTDVVLLLPPLADTNLSVFGTIDLYRNSATTASGVALELFIRKEAATGDAAGHCRAHGAASTAFSLITCTYGGVQRIGVRMTASGVGTVLSDAFFTGRYIGSQAMRLVPASAVTSIAAFVQRSGFLPVSDFLQPVRTPVYTVATLPAAATFARSRAFVSDANATTFASIVAGGGANLVPVYSDGTNWRIG